MLLSYPPPTTTTNKPPLQRGKVGSVFVTRETQKG